MLDRHARVPNANNPHLLWRLVDAMAEGNRSARSLGEALGIEARTVAYYEQAAHWLGLLDDEGDLTALGLELAYAGDARAAVHGKACWDHPVAGRWLDASDGDLPSVELLARSIAASEPDLSVATVERRAGAVRGLLGPALGVPRPRLKGATPQLGLPFRRMDLRPETLRVASPHDPDAYAWCLRELLDAGELSLGNLRALLDEAGASELPLGECVDLAVRRGDAVRVGERLVATGEAMARADVACSAVGVVLTDPGYRRWLVQRVEPTSDALRRQYRAWDRRLFGGRPRADALHARLTALVPDRPLDALPVAEGPATAPTPTAAPFLDLVDEPGMWLAFPSSVRRVAEGPAALDRLLREGRATDSVAVPTVWDRPFAVHGALVHPGGAPPRALPDLRTLRLRAVAHCPAIALATAALLAHRRSRGDVEVGRRADELSFKVAGRLRGPLLPELAVFARARGWTVFHRGGAGRLAPALLAVLVALGVASPLERRVVLSERLYAALRTEPEEGLLYAPLARLADALVEWAAR